MSPQQHGTATTWLTGSNAHHTTFISEASTALPLGCDMSQSSLGLLTSDSAVTGEHSRLLRVHPPETPAPAFRFTILSRNSAGGRISRQFGKVRNGNAYIKMAEKKFFLEERDLGVKITITLHRAMNFPQLLQFILRCNDSPRG